MQRRLHIKIGALLLATVTLMSSTVTYATPTNNTDKIVVGNTQYNEYSDLVSLKTQFSTMLNSKEYLSSGKYPYELYGPIVSYAIVLNKLKANNPEISNRYQNELLDMVELANSVKVDNVSPIDASSNKTIISSSVSILLNQYEIIKTNFKSLSGGDGSENKATELYNYVTGNSNYVYNVLNAFVMIRKYESLYEDDSNNYCITVESIESVNTTLEALYELYSNINQEFGVDSLASKVKFNKESTVTDLVWDGNTDNLNPLYLYGLSLTATFIPFVTDTSKQDTYQYFFENVTGDSKDTLLSMLQYRKPIYATISKTAGTDYLNGQTFKGIPITLQQFLDAFKNTDKEIIMCLRKDSLSDMGLTIDTTANGEQVSSGAQPEPSTEPDQEPQDTQEEETNADEIQNLKGSSTEKTEVGDKDKYGFTEPVFLAGLMKDGDINSRGVYTTETVDYLLRDKHYVRVSNFNFGLMFNIVNSTNTGQKITDDLNKPLSMDIFGNIVTSSGIVILPAIANTTLYDYSISNYQGSFDPANKYQNYFFPENATFKLAYPYIDEYNGAITTAQDSFINKFTFATNTNCLKNTSDISNLNYYLKFMSSSDIKERKKGVFQLLRDSVLSTTHDIQYPTFAIYPYQIGRTAVNDDGTRKQLINKGSFSSIFSKNGFHFKRGEDDQHYILNVGHVLVSDQSGNYYDTANIGFSPSVTQGIYDLTKYYLIMDKSTGTYDTTTPKHNNTFKAKFMKTIALQVSQGSKDVDEMLVGEDISNLNFKEGDQGWFTSIVGSWGESLHFSISKSKYFGSLLYTPQIDELPLFDRLAVVVKPILIILAIFGIFGLILSWRPFGFIPHFPMLIVKILIYFTIVASIFKLMPSFITQAVNMPVTRLYRDVSILNSMTDLEVKQKNIKTTYFKGYSELDTSQSATYIVLAQLSFDQYRQIYETVYGSTGFITEFGFLSYFNSVTQTQVYDNLYLQGNKLCMTLDSVFESSVIKAYENPTGDEMNTKQFIVPELKQSWYKASELHYFTPYYLMSENLLHVLNTVTTETNSNVFPLDYSTNTYKVTGFLRNYMKSNYYLKTSSERMKIINDLAEDIKKAKEAIETQGNEEMDLDTAISSVKLKQGIIEVITGIDIDLRTNRDFLGITKWSGLHTSSDTEKPFGDGVIDDIATENEILGVPQKTTGEEDKEVENRTLKNTQSAWWYNNEYFNKARWQLERIDSKSKLADDEVELVINGRPVKQTIPIKKVNNRLYILPESLILDTPDTSYGISSDGNRAIFTPQTIVDIVDTEGTKVKLYSNGAYLGEVDTIESDGKKLVALTDTKGSLDASGSSIGSALNADVYYNGQYNTVMIFYPEMPYAGDIGLCYTKILKVNDNVRNFMDSLYDISLNVSDENMIKAIALNGIIEFNKQFTSSEHPLYPNSIEMNSLNFDVLMKQLLIPTTELSRSASSHSLFNYLATTSGLWACVFGMLLEICIVIMIILRDSILAFHIIALPTLSICFYVFSSKWFYKPWLGTLISFLGVAILNLLTMSGFLMVNALTATSSSEVMWAILVGIIVSILGIVGYGYLWHIVFKDFKNLGYLKAKGVFSQKFSDLRGKLSFDKDKKNAIDSEVDADEVVSSRLGDMTTSTESKLSAVERYSSDVSSSGNLSAKIDINSGTTTASSLATELATSVVEGSEDGFLDQRFEQILPTSYASLSKQGASVSRSTLNELNKQYHLKHGKDYQLIGETPFVTNEEVLKREGLKQSYSVVSPYTKELVRELNDTETPFTVEKDMVRYVSDTKEGILQDKSKVHYDNGVLVVPSNAKNTVKDYLKSQDIDFKQRGEKFSIKNKETFTSELQNEVNKITQPIKVKPKADIPVNGVATDDGASVVSPDSLLSDVTAISNRIHKMQSKYSKRSASSINSKSINKLFSPEQEVYTYSLHIDKDKSVSPLVNDLHQIAQKVESNTARNKALTLRTTDGVSVVFESQEDYNAFKNKFTEATADYFVRPTIHKEGDKVSVYTLNGNNLESRQMTLSEFETSDFKGVKCRELK